ncbi:hypothetical protein TIFTF001_011054 [Ficus carica]|uniref:Uncharacterized protein n=1 Tax=Ficus carica TaxID=3494 RepID=A0AA88A9R6_FICCA|nr:hypothetical protein TIFTF001_011054 [Ficus carica]
MESLLVYEPLLIRPALKNNVALTDVSPATPWLAVPFGDIVKKKRLIHWFKVERFPTAIVISSSGRIVT